ncbi:Secreted molybdate-binding protein [Corynebacterium glyciniphilum AJ 3170]|uniref:Secreted molybdate-binding protein n=1 Tax=Corynebacterium glyciniphilum AJ 3170 TaxID=1404245 RepID=X5DPI1_9CORY|nr:molybdate ABC transporter substrate-binding protein [Corynebacterium glyciniphilum]AHW63194.1 Secreted molybdate-binding protein [Corynebacterium glyciniphilum AJ 3170]
MSVTTGPHIGRRRLGVLRAFSAAVAGAGLLFASACSTSGESDESADTTDGASGGTGTVEVFAAASLNNAGDELAEAFAEDNDGAELEFNFAGSSKLVQQIEQGADADVFISADEENMDAALDLPEFDGAEPEAIATNRLVLATAPGNPAGFDSVDDLSTTADFRLAVCADGVPCGTLANDYLDEREDGGHGLGPSTVSEEANVSDVSTKLATGEADVGFIYSTDAKALQENSTDGEVEVFDLDAVEPNKYPAALTTAGEDNDAAAAFLQWLTSDRARGILESYGFGAA